MSGQFKPVVLEPAGVRRSRSGAPRWLIVLLLGAALGGGGMLLLQSHSTEPRVSSNEATQLRAASDAAEAESRRLQGELAAATQRLEVALGEKKAAADELARSRETAIRLREDVAALLAALPPDTRGGPIEIRAGRFTVEGGKLSYNLILSRKRAEGAAFNGVVQLVVSGVAGGTGSTFISNPLPLAIEQHQTLRGSLPLPDGFKPKQTTIKVLDRVDGKPQGMRIMLVE